MNHHFHGQFVLKRTENVLRLHNHKSKMSSPQVFHCAWHHMVTNQRIAHANGTHPPTGEGERQMYVSVTKTLTEYIFAIDPVP